MSDRDVKSRGDFHSDCADCVDIFLQIFLLCLAMIPFIYMRATVAAVEWLLGLDY